MSKYICTFESPGGIVRTETENGIAEFCLGFWVDSNFKFTKGMNCKYWIPPSRILYVEVARIDDQTQS